MRSDAGAMTAPDSPARHGKKAAASGAAGKAVARRRVTIVNERGLHARAAAKFAKVAIDALTALITGKFEENEPPA